MSANCLVTQLKAVVDNDNLKKLGVISFDQPAGNTYFSLQAASADCKFNVYNKATGALIDSIALNQYFYNYNFTVESRVEIINKYSLQRLYTDQLSPIPTIDDVEFLTELTDLFCIFPLDIADFGRLTKIERIGSDSGVFENGEILRLVAKQKENGRATCNGIRMEYGHIRNMSLNGVSTYDIEIIEPENSQYIIWTATYVIVANAPLNSATKVMTYGMSDGEIATLRTTYPSIQEVTKCD